MDDLTSLNNQLLIATPALIGSGFEKTVVYICEHNEHGAVGLVINQPLEHQLSFVFEQMGLEVDEPSANEIPLLFGGPVQPERGFVIHKPGGQWRSSIAVQEDVAITTSRDVLRALAAGDGPDAPMVALGYAGWASDQLELELQQNSWLLCPFEPTLLFDVPFDKRWHVAANSIGIDITRLSSDIGHA